MLTQPNIFQREMFDKNALFTCTSISRKIYATMLIL